MSFSARTNTTGSSSTSDDPEKVNRSTTDLTCKALGILHRVARYLERREYDSLPPQILAVEIDKTLSEKNF
jgi:hypothetical protein